MNEANIEITWESVPRQDASEAIHELAVVADKLVNLGVKRLVITIKPPALK